MLQAVFAVEDDGNIISPVSKYCKNIFEKAIIGKNEGEIVEVMTPSGKIELEIELVEHI